MNLVDVFKKNENLEETTMGNFIGPIHVHKYLSTSLQVTIIKDVLKFLENVNFKTEVEVLLSSEIIQLKKLDKKTIEVLVQRGGRKFPLAQLKESSTWGYYVIYTDSRISQK